MDVPKELFKQFTELRVVNRTNGLIRGDFTIRLDPEVEPRPAHEPDGSHIVYIREPRGNERHIVLGKFMDVWSQLESCIAVMLCDSAGIALRNGSVFMNALGTRGQTDVIALMAPQKLTNPQKVELTALLERIKRANTRRNHIVHGQWALEAILQNHNGRVGTKLTQYRIYSVSDPAVRDAMRQPENRDERAKYMFSVARIRSLTKSLDRLANDVSAFWKRVRGMPPDAKRFLVEGLVVRP